MYNRLFFYPRPFGYCSKSTNDNKINDNKLIENKIADDKKDENTINKEENNIYNINGNEINKDSTIDCKIKEGKTVDDKIHDDKTDGNKTVEDRKNSDKINENKIIACSVNDIEMVDIKIDDDTIKNDRIMGSKTYIKPVESNQYLYNNNHRKPPLLNVSNSSVLKVSTLGGITLPDNTDKGTTYNLASINMETSNCKDCYVQLNFCCNVFTERADVYLRFQIFKQIAFQLTPVPASVGLTYVRSKENSEFNAFSLNAFDSDFIKNKTSNYSVIVEVMGGATKGTTIISNPILIATIVMNN